MIYLFSRSAHSARPRSQTRMMFLGSSGSFWSDLVTILGLLGAVMRPLETVLGVLGTVLGRSWLVLGGLGAVWGGNVDFSLVFKWFGGPGTPAPLPTTERAGAVEVIRGRYTPLPQELGLEDLDLGVVA